MNTQKQNDHCPALTDLCATVKMLNRTGALHQSWTTILHAMNRYPHAPEPHNLIGILLEMEGDHTKAMKHFRAALALDPTFLAARQNLESFGTFYSKGTYAYDENDCFDSIRDRDAIETETPAISQFSRRQSHGDPQAHEIT